MKMYTSQEALTMLRNNPVLYAEIAHNYPCCNLPQADNCCECTKKEYCPMHDEANQEIFDRINKMSQEEMARLRRFAPVGHLYFDSSKPFFKVFEKRFNELGGFTPAISKKIKR